MPIAHADDLLRHPPKRALISSPATFSGTLDELWDDYIEPNLPDPAVVADFHQALADYVAGPGRLLLVRRVGDMERRSDYITNDGARLRATDNAPAWWVHFALFQGCRVAPNAFGHVVETVPTHLFDVARAMPTSASAAGWHIAHVFAVKDGRTDYHAWQREDAVARFIRNIHSCNHGLVPKPQWQRWGGDARVLGYFVARFAHRYDSVWDEFLQLAQADASAIPHVAAPIPYSYARDVIGPTNERSDVDEPHPRSRGSGSRVRASYLATRLLFRRDIIEPLTDDEVFQVTTPEGTFAMTKAEFARVVGNVRESMSYRVRGVYHYRTTPKAALRFLNTPAS